ncbi:guanine nucleotide exchange factor subunit RIC1 [Nilaparvata lugens]|uniref:guanine nucleotide exchange factor subunit RIC1 n=1 Tax=Nilaparvata lugens TaxID=108931 RepID=UPI00193C8E81|nr:guanine nucleotide exchange factor subunit RIC1 [Nilaparvata lugens]
MIFARRWQVLLAASLLVGYCFADDNLERREKPEREERQTHNEVADATKSASKETTQVRIGSAAVKKTAKNADLLRKLGLVKLKGPSASHHRKRLASQSRGARPGDSHVVVVKLPPAPHYYTHSRPLTQPFDKLGVGFFSNGRPARISPLNLPLAEKSLQARRARPNIHPYPNTHSSLHPNAHPNAHPSAHPSSHLSSHPSSLINIHPHSSSSTAQKWQSTLDVHDFRHDDDLAQMHAVSYYKPKGPTKKAFHKYLAANGKLHSFYVMSTHKKKKKIA